jgi:hypothetical protein
MSKFIVTTLGFSALVAATLGLAVPAEAVPQGQTAAQTAAGLQAQGYRVAYNGSLSAPLSARCPRGSPTR